MGITRKVLPADTIPNSLTEREFNATWIKYNPILYENIYTLYENIFTQYASLSQNKDIRPE